MDDLVKNILIMAALLALSAYFSATETAFNSMNRTRVRAMAEKGGQGRGACAEALGKL